MKTIFYIPMMAGVCLLSGMATSATAQDSRPQDGYVQDFSGNFIECRGHFFEGKAPTLVGAKGKKLNNKLDTLCFDGFAVLHSGVSRTPFWSAEYLTQARIKKARTLTRNDSFRPESRLPHDRRAELGDYSRSGYDRGHLAPNGDMSDTNTQYESFSLANIAPQNGTHNRNLWRQIETDTRDLTKKYGEVYVVTGVLFNGQNIKRIGNRVLVPSHFYKAVYIPSINKAGVYYSPNTENPSYDIISLAEFSKRTGISPMPTLPSAVQNHAHALPEPNLDNARPKPKNNNQNSPKNSDNDANADKIDLSSVHGWLLLILEIIKFFVNLSK